MSNFYNNSINFLPVVPVGAPLVFRNSSTNFTNVTVQWSPVECSQRNGEIDGYKLTYHPTENSKDIKSILILGSANRAFTIVGLQPRINYTLILSATNSNFTSFGPSVEITVATSVPNGM